MVAERLTTVQLAASDQLAAELRTRCFRANAAASEADFRWRLPQLRDAELLNRAEASGDREVEALRQRYGNLLSRHDPGRGRRPGAVGRLR